MALLYPAGRLHRALACVLACVLALRQPVSGGGGGDGGAQPAWDGGVPSADWEHFGASIRRPPPVRWRRETQCSEALTQFQCRKLIKLSMMCRWRKNKKICDIDERVSCR